MTEPQHRSMPPAPAPEMAEPAGPAEPAPRLLRTEGLTKHFKIGGTTSRRTLHAVEDVDLDIGEHEIVALADYRLRYAAYRADPDLQRLHQLFPMIVMWDRSPARLRLSPAPRSTSTTMPRSAAVRSTDPAPESHTIPAGSRAARSSWRCWG